MYCTFWIPDWLSEAVKVRGTGLLCQPRSAPVIVTVGVVVSCCTVTAGPRRWRSRAGRAGSCTLTVSVGTAAAMSAGVSSTVSCVALTNVVLRSSRRR